MIEDRFAPNRSNRLPDDTAIGSITLNVGDIERSVAFYSDVIGMTPIETSSSAALLEFDDDPRLRLLMVPGARPAPGSVTGLYHMAILVPSRVELGRSLARLVERGYPLGGASDHLVSEALYLSDPDGNGIEIYRDRPRDEWPIDGGRLRMDTLPLDLRGLLEEAHTARRPWTGLAPGTSFGHIHLQVDDLATARAFYCDVLGFDVMVDLTRMGALFISAGGYHHHIGLNTWHSRGGSRRTSGSAGLVSFDIDVVDASALTAIEERLTAAGHHVNGGSGAISVEDPAGNTVVVSASRFGAVERVTGPIL